MEASTRGGTLQNKLGDLGSSERLIQDLYIDLRNKVGAWSAVTQQTPQARMGYVGQHLVSVVTGYPGGKSGARGFDLVIPNKGHGEIKTCYRVDQLGACQACNAPVSSLETACSDCGSVKVTRKDDSKWLLSVKTESDFKQLLEPVTYYFVLFEFEDLIDAANPNIIASIWQVNPLELGFALCMIDYKLNIQTGSKSGAPFNLWPYSVKFALMKPTLIYQSRILTDSIETIIFPGQRGEPTQLALPNMSDLLKKRTLSLDSLVGLLEVNGLVGAASFEKKTLAIKAQEMRSSMDEGDFIDQLALAVYRPMLAGKSAEIPRELKARIPLLETL